MSNSSMIQSFDNTERQILTISETVSRAKSEGYPLSEYTLRRALRSGSIPCRTVGRKYLIAWQNVVKWLLCEDGQDNAPVALTPATVGIRRIER
ncbi:MAG: hypothetical protein LUE11_00630 [Clostridia bacterium]|nr:hypothetical protein [Clostridia bacterium]